MCATLTAPWCVPSSHRFNSDATRLASGNRFLPTSALERTIWCRLPESIQPAVALPVVRPHLAADLDGGGDRRLQALGRSVGHARQPNAADPFGGLLCRNHDQHLALSPASSLARSRPADEYLIDFDDALQPLTSGTNHRPAQLVQQIPRRAITPQPQHPLQAQGAGPAFLAGHVPQRFEPQTQGQMRVREQGPRRHRGLPTAPPAVTQAPRRDPMIRPLTYRAAEPFRPPQSGEI